MYPKLAHTIDQLANRSIPEERKPALQQLADYITDKVEKEESIALNFICTHNSRRSHLGQIWAQVAAAHYGIKSVQCYSGGTEATAMYPMIIEALESQGMSVLPLSEGTNPVYAVKYGADTAPVICFSKEYDHPYNPVTGYHAVLTCSHADENCPVILGADHRTAITYLDPKAYDGTPAALHQYLVRSEQVGAELLYCFGLVES